MFRSGSRPAALAAAALATGLLLTEPALAGAPAPTPQATVVPGPTPGPGDRVNAPVVDIDTPTSDIYVRVEDLDGRLTEAESTSRVELTLAADVLFAFGSAELSPAAKGTVAELAERLRAQAKGTVHVDGHTDSIGGDAANLALSRRRADAVREEILRVLSGTGIQIETAGYGEARPVAPNAVDGRDNPGGRARNRRVEIRFDR